LAGLVAPCDYGYDYVGTIREQRRAWWGGRPASAAMNFVRERISGIRMTDQGCMLRGYSRSIVSAINQSREVTTFLPALGSLYALRSIEIPVRHAERDSGTSKYSLYRLIRLNFDLMTGFSLVPLQLFSMGGIVVSLLSLLFVVFLVVRRVLVGPEAQGVFTLFAILFLMIGIVLFGIGLLGEYIGRIYLQVRDRPRYLVQAVIEEDRGDAQ
jgi:undecaprenyl-phosphate 4-deoxy-4-formamido-L-arabinose transferase